MLMRLWPLPLVLGVGLVVAPLVHQLTCVAPLMRMRLLHLTSAVVGSSVESCSVSPGEVVGVYGEFRTAGAAGFVVAPEDGPPFQLCCLLLCLAKEDAVSFEYAC